MTPKRVNKPADLPLVGPQIERTSRLHHATRVQYTYHNPVPDPKLNWYPQHTRTETMMDKQRRLRVDTRFKGKVKI